MNRTRRIIAGTIASGVIATGALVGGTAQAHAGPWDTVCKYLGWGIGPQGCR